jgi:shikimate kinase
VIWLKAPVDVILDRLQADPTTGERRPSLTGLPPREEIEQLLAQREPLYAATATFQIETAGRTVDSLLEELCCRLKGPPSADDAPEGGR